MKIKEQKKSVLIIVIFLSISASGLIYFGTSDAQSLSDGLVFNSTDAHGEMRFESGATFRNDTNSLVFPETRTGAVTVDPPLETSDELTYSIWIKPDTLNERTAVVSRGLGEVLYPRIFIEADGSVVSQWRSEGETHTIESPHSVIEEGQWNHLALAIAGDENAVGYVNGDTKITANVLGNQIDGGDYRMKIGYDSDIDSGFAGEVRDFQVYERKLPNHEIMGLYRGKDKTYPNLTNPLISHYIYFSTTLIAALLLFTITSNKNESPAEDAK